jgi:UDP-2-acetamido-3-amino-2,3-dideoxy-glucuronate N-acetyltransferase
MKLEDFKIAIIGSGRWGMNHVKTAVGLLPPGNITVVDTNPAAAEKVKAISPEIKFATDLQTILEDASITAAIIATPAETHFSVAKRCLLNGKNTLVEKPITLLIKDAEELLALAASKNLKLMVGHILLYHPAVLKIKEMVDDGLIGNLQYIYSNRLNLGAIRSEENILWSFAPHDISVIQFLTGVPPISIKATGAAFVQPVVEDTTLTYLEYPNGIHAHIFVSWLHPFKEQRLVVIGEKGMIVFEDSLPKDKLKFYKKGFKVENSKVEKFDAEPEVISFADAQALAEEQKHFFDCVLGNKDPRTNGQHALEVLRILDAATKEIKKVD